jgi:hypothetical protein
MAEPINPINRDPNRREPPRPEPKAEEKPEEKKEEPSAWTIEAVILVILLLAGVLTTLGRSRWLERFNNGDFHISFESIFDAIISWLPDWLVSIVRQFTVAYITFATIVSLFFLLGLIYALIRWRQYAIVWQDQLYPSPEAIKQPEVKNAKWTRVEAHIGSDNPSDWRLAILEADIILDELLDTLGFIGDTIGDRLKKANKGDFQTLDYAWEAHKIRNAIAHEGSDFILTQREAQRIIGLYRTVFEEFDYI